MKLGASSIEVTENCTKKNAPRERSAKVLTVGGFETYADF